MIDSMLAFLAMQIGSLAAENLAQMVVSDEKVRQDFRQIAGELRIVQGFLQHVEARRARIEGMDEWVGQLREAAYDVEDLVDEYRDLIQGHHRGGLQGHVHNAVHLVEESFRARKIAAEVQSVRGKISQITSFFQLNGKEYDGRSHEGPSNFEIQGGLPGFDEGDIVVGIDGSKDQVIRLLTNGENQRKVVSVWGMGGLGKTTLARTVYKHPEVAGHFTVRAWVCCSKSSSNVDGLLKSMMDELRGAMSASTHDVHDHELSQRLSQERYLIVIDHMHVRSLPVFHTLVGHLPSNNNGSRILVTTRNEDIATSVSIDRSYVLNMSLLSDTDARLLLHKAAFGGPACPPELDRWCGVITDKCGGLPLAVVAMGRMMAGKPRTDIAWESMCRRLEWEMSNNEMLGGVTRVLMLSYKCLPYHLQRCFLYCSLFREGHLIKTKWLVRMWIAEGYVVEDAGHHNMTPEEIGVGYVEQLAARSMIQVVDKDAVGRPKVFQVHDITRNLALKASEGENLCAMAADQLAEVDSRCRRLSITQGLGEKVRVSHHFSKIRTLLVSSIDQHSSTSSSLQTICSSLKYLRVLDLKGAPIHVVASNVFELFNLRYLSLRGTNVAEIPSTLEKLYNLQTLDLSKTEVAKLPRAIVKLQRLRHLYVEDILAEKLRYRNVGGLLRGRDAPSGIGGLTNLQTLRTIQASRRTFAELEHLTQLRQLGVTNLDANLGAELCESVSQLRRLSRLCIRASEGQILELDGFSPSLPALLHKLTLNGRLRCLPTWFSSLRSLTHLRLCNAQLKEDESPLPPLGRLPNLLLLSLDNAAYGGELLYFEAEAFGRLQTLMLSELAGLSELIVQNGGLPSLQVMHLRSLELNDMQGIQYIGGMQELHLTRVTIQSSGWQINPGLRVFIS